ncbi:predicted protein [Thalassiosira pseudonana CCMP1335]|uniref:V-type proton ATPase proteolipid subunit n=1 Tax=Thalassiosira pseudonana TaxID=35128 RepID=B5YML1_THAPS|nr:predicted protein [Thalassiosira pseudonana CCMP1335]ACI64479.1 predicted protein [Thalassiosira pseudonana CCMP1335]
MAYLEVTYGNQCPSWALSVGYLGVASAAVLSNWGSAWGTWKAGVSLVNTGIRHPGSIMKNVIPVVMAGVIGIYGLIIAVILAESIPKPNLCAGLCCGLSGLAAGGCIGIVGEYGVRYVSGSDDQNKLFVGMLIMLIFSEALALYGLIVALIVSQHSFSCGES